MSDKAKIKEMKISLVLNEESRAAMLDMINGGSDCVYLDCVYFEHLCLDDIKVDGMKICDLKLKRGLIKCLKIRAIEEC